MDNIWSNVRELIAQGQLSEALNLLRQQPGLDGEADTELILLQARLSHLEREERLIGTRQTIERNQLTKNALDFIQKQENVRATEKMAANPADFIANMRRNSLQQKIKDVYGLLEQWEQKQSLSDNPTETQRCSLEINRLQGILDGYVRELNHLG